MKNIRTNIKMPFNYGNKMPFNHGLVYNPHTYRVEWRGLDIGKLVLSTVWYDIVYKKQKAIVDNQVIMPFLLTMQSIKLKI